MKKLILSIIAILFLTPCLMAQATQQGMKYQAVARDLSGDILANQQVVLKIKLQNDTKSNNIHYTEVHTATTNQFGLFSLVIGEGAVEKGTFNEIPWSTQDIWMTIDIKSKGKSGFTTISSSKLLAVPYAFHAATASKIVNSKGANDINGPGNTAGVPSQNWSLFGNSNSDPNKDKLGTTDSTDVVFVTNNKERLRITADGQIITGPGKFTIGGNLEVQGDSTRINKDLFVGRNVVLNFDDEFNPRGETINHGNFTVENMSSTLLTGTLNVNKGTNLDDILNVDGETDLNNQLRVNNESATLLTGTLNVNKGTDLDDILNVDGETDLNSALNVNNQSATSLTGSLAVGEDLDPNLVTDFVGDANAPTKLNGTLDVVGLTSTNGLVNAGAFSTKRLIVADIVDDGEFVATFVNDNEGDGDGIKIKLGKTHPAWNGAWLEVNEPFSYITNTAAEKVRDWFFKDTVNFDGDITQIGELLDGSVDLPAAVNNAVCKMGADVVQDVINIFGPVLDPVETAVNVLIDITNILNDPIIGVEDNDPIDLGDLSGTVCGPAFGGGATVNVVFADVDNSLTNENQFISFTDMNDRELGSINAVSVTDWSTGYFDGAYIMAFLGDVVSIDPVAVIVAFQGKAAEAADAYNKIGVEYTSGHGDYAEWLERVDSNEIISRGDIVAVVGGKITKNLEDAEQIMAVSEYPIMLGNIPSDDTIHLGNNVAFMGQIPVKIMGSVKTGDYILANRGIPGYGVAVNPKDMSIEDFNLVVGRSWEENPSEGPKMVNTVVGVHNGDYLKILQKQEIRFLESEARLENLESKVDLILSVNKMELSN